MHTFIDDPGELADALRTIDEPLVGLDVERADSNNYFRTAALIQVGTADHVLLVDSIALDPVPGLTEFLADRRTVLHALENDLESLRAVGVEVGEVEDTGIAASMLGMPIGLDPLLQERLDVALSPDKNRFQRADWSQRPLPDDMAAYAAGDVLHLGELWEDMEGLLDEAGRTDWYRQERDQTVATAFDDPRDWTRTKGSGRLDEDQRAVLKALWEEREAICREFDIAPNRLLRDQTLMSLAEKPARDARDLIRRNKRRGRPSRVHAERLFDAQNAGLDGPPEPKEQSGSGWSRAHRDAFDAMRKARSKVAKKVEIDPGVLCPSRVLWQPVHGDPDTPDELCELAGLRPWQRELLAIPLWEAYTEALAEAD